MGVGRRQFLRDSAIAAGGLVVGGGAVAELRRRDAMAARRAASERAHTETGPPDDRFGAADVVWRVTTDKPYVALTMDDGPSAAYTAAFLDVLAAKKVRATFFLVAEEAERRPDLVRREVAEGHEIGSHTWSHADLGRLDTAAVHREVVRAHESLGLVAGRMPSLLRPPYGNTSGATLRAAGELGYDIVLWSVKLKEVELDAAANARWVAEHAKPGAIVLAHDAGGDQRKVGLAALPQLIDLVRGQGLELVTVSQLLASRTAPAAS